MSPKVTIMDEDGSIYGEKAICLRSRQYSEDIRKISKVMKEQLYWQIIT